MFTITPGNTWNGTAGSGYVSPPSDPTRTVAKPALKFHTVPHQIATGQFVVAVGALCLGGVSKVTFYCEGNTVDVTARTVIDGCADLHAIIVDVPNIATTGRIAIYAEAVPVNGTFQNRVMGPFYLWVDKNNTLTGSSTDPIYYVDGTGSNGTGTIGSPFNNIMSALTAHKNNNSLGGQIIIKTAGTYILTTSGIVQSTAIRWIKIIGDPSLTLGQVQINGSGIASLIRLYFNFGWWENVSFNQSTFSQLYNETTDTVCYKNIEMYDSNGAEYIYSNAVRQTGSFRLTSGTTSYLDGIKFHDIGFPIAGATLVKNSTLYKIAQDFFDDCYALFNNTSGALITDNIRGAYPFLNAFTVICSTSGATIQKTGSSGSVAGTIKLIDSINGTTTINLTSGVMVLDVVNAINAKTGWTAVNQYSGQPNGIGSLQAAYLSQGNNNLEAMPVAISATTTVQMVIGADLHSDYIQHNSNAENILHMGNIYNQKGFVGYGQNTSQGYFLSGRNFADFGIANCITSNPVNIGIQSQLANGHDHVYFESCTWAQQDGSANQNISIRTDTTYTAVNCGFVNCALPLVTGTIPAGLTFTNCNFESGTTSGSNPTSGIPSYSSNFTPNVGSNLLYRRNAPFELSYDIYGNTLNDPAAIGAVQASATITRKKFFTNTV